MRFIRLLPMALVSCFPWFLKRRFLNHFWNYKLAPDAKIGISFIYPQHLTMEAGASIASGVVAINIESLHMCAWSSIDRGTWITGHPKGSDTHFTHETERDPSLYIGTHSAITKGHIIDCTSSVNIGKYSTIAGYRSQILTHSINILNCRQQSAPIKIGDYCFLGTNVLLIGGAEMADYTVLSAGSLLNKKFTTNYALIGGVPAKIIKEIPANAKYFTRSVGFIK
ncbi:MAG: hypothetical protein RL077_672 [Verrucomicrobiota bacterium]|jgi:serine acetyltransferase